MSYWNGFDYGDPGCDPDYCNGLSIDPDDERWQDERDAADQAEADAAKQREMPMRKPQTPAA